MPQNWPILAGCLGAVLPSCLIERFVFKKRIGIFAILFWLLVLQFLIIYLSVYAAMFLENHNWVFLGGLFKGVGAIFFMTIGVIPFIALPLSILTAAVILAFQYFRPAE
ncbi:hypothetical protein LHFGNBLO_000524 [Mesorhizobium sp. AR10]|uniref:hypothetical protein n=1 Tax=Mesorhizobium sp. AR10 TaxID=2865839 RepID=UPI00215E7ECB|nr:hypothetical protein [Mesorhizobium sp. AR10]UVK39190.1 hypothetical protein LHFGNBLO_000524 [Mesorhizobium sp. AR10]